MLLITVLINVILLVNHTFSQSTCPVKQPNRCKCGIKTDGNIYIYCARKQLNEMPKFTRSSILYDELILSGNKFETVNVAAFSGLKVKRLYLDENPIRDIQHESFAELANYLEELYLSVPSAQETESRTKLPTKLFQNLLNLKIVKVRGMQVYDGEYSDQNGILTENLFNRTRKLEIIHLIASKLTQIEFNALKGVESSLKELNLDNNQLSSTQEIFYEVSRLKRLKLLNLSRNKITRLDSFNINYSPDMDSTLPSELQLDLSSNYMREIDLNAFNYISKSIQKLMLNNNELTEAQF
jgi:hypothetical protein